MTDYPIEQAQHDRELRRMRRGSVLVGGLGLGYAALLLALRPGIRQVVVVEKEAAVIHLVKDALLKRLGPCASKVSVVHADLFDFLRARTLKTRWAFYDIWTSDGEGTLVETVLPLLDLSRGLVQHQPVCWNEGVMRGQLALALSTRLQMLAAGHSWVPEGQTPLTMDDLCREPVPDDHYRAFQLMRAHFFRWARRHKRLARQGVYCSAYAGLYGQWDWQEKWDAYWRSRAYSDRRPARLSKRG